MKYIFKETTPNYGQYIFPYKVYAIKEKTDSYIDIFNQGFLPTRFDQYTYVLNRSSKVKLSNFSLSSENRRILKKGNKLYTFQIINYDELEYNYQIQKFARDFTKFRFKDSKPMNVHRIKDLFTSGKNNKIAVFSRVVDEITVGFVLLMEYENIRYYNFAFYDLAEYKNNLGMFMMTTIVNDSKEKNMTDIYLGSVYTVSSLYKTQFKGFNWFTGEEWSNDKEELKKIIQS